MANADKSLTGAAGEHLVLSRLLTRGLLAATVATGYIVVAIEANQCRRPLNAPGKPADSASGLRTRRKLCGSHGVPMLVGKARSWSSQWADRSLASATRAFCLRITTTNSGNRYTGIDCMQWCICEWLRACEKPVTVYEGALKCLAHIRHLCERPTHGSTVMAITERCVRHELQSSICCPDRLRVCSTSEHPEQIKGNQL